MTIHTIKAMRGASIAVAPSHEMPGGELCDNITIMARVAGIAHPVALHFTPDQCGALIFAIEHAAETLGQVAA